MLWRNLRPQRMTASRIWVAPAVLVFMTALMVWGSVAVHASPLTVALFLILGAIAGVPFGLLRGRHSRVRTTGDPHVLIVDPSIGPLLIWIGAFGLRFGLRQFLPHAGPTALAASDGFLAFAVASVVASRYVILTRFKALHAL